MITDLVQIQRLGEKKLKSRFRHYTNLSKMESRLRSLLERYPFQSFRELLGAEQRHVEEPVDAQTGRA